MRSGARAGNLAARRGYESVHASASASRNLTIAVARSLWEREDPMRTLLFLLAGSLAGATPAGAQRWALTWGDAHSFRHLDESRILTLDHHVFRVWTRLEGTQPLAHAAVRGGVFRVMLAERDVDCWAVAWRTRQRLYHTDAGELLLAEGPVEGWRYPYPGTSDHRELVELCRLLVGDRFPGDRRVVTPVRPWGDGAPPVAGEIPRAVPTPTGPGGLPPKRTPGTRRSP